MIVKTKGCVLFAFSNILLYILNNSTGQGMLSVKRNEKLSTFQAKFAPFRECHYVRFLIRCLCNLESHN